MNVQEILASKHFELLTKIPLNNVFSIEHIYCGDLLSSVMVHMPKKSAWCTVMGYINTVAIAKLCNAPLVILCENTRLDLTAQKAAMEERICIIKTPLPVFEAACYLQKYI